MRTATTLHLIGGKWACVWGPSDVTADNGLPADKQRALAQDVSKWPADSRACVIAFSDGRTRRYYRTESDGINDRMKAFQARAVEKANLAETLEAKRKLDESAAEAKAKKDAAALNSKLIAEKEAMKAKLKSDRSHAEAGRVQPTKTTTTK